MFEDFNISKFDIKLIMYVIGCILTLTLGTYKIFQYYQMLGAIIFFVGALYVCIIYGIRWFNNASSSATAAWPPVINTCPDYLTYYERKKDGKIEPSCIDTIGVAKKNGLKIFPKDGDSNSDVGCFFTIPATNALKCQQAINMGLTWEGITNGESCTSGGSTAPDSTAGCPAPVPTPTPAPAK